MIRREQHNEWWLIPQAAHARIAAELAAAWPLDAPVPVPALMIAVRHHDDGWPAWERAPTLNDDRQPREFTEMPMRSSTGIWTGSIEVCGALSLWAGVWVSRHFCWLAERARENRPDSPDDQQAVAAFLEQQSQRQSGWLSRLRAHGGNGNVEALADAGFRLVQFFDRLSLWLCCAPRSEPFRITEPAAPGAPNAETELRPARDGLQVTVVPQRLRVPELELTVTARVLPDAPLADDVSYRRALAEAPQRLLTWRLSNG